eukprot:199282_1
MSTETVKSGTNSVYNIIANNKFKSAIIAVSSALSIRYIYNKLYRKYRSLPPGPEGLPFIGCLFYTPKIQTFCNYISMTYGPIAYFTIGLQTFLLIGHSSLSKQLLEDKNCQDRPKFESPGRSKYFISFVQMRYNNKCIKRRKYAQSIFVASCTSEHINKILSDTMLSDMILNINKCCDSNIQWAPKNDLKYLTWNIVFHLNFGRSILRSDKLYKELERIENLKDGFSLFKLVTFAAVPLISKIYPSFFKYEQTVLSAEIELYKKIFAKRRAEINLTDNNYKPETYCDYLLKAQFNGEMNEEEAIADVLLMYIAGSDTTSNTIYWGLVLIAKYVVIQEKVRNELLEVYGKINNINEFNLRKLTKLPIFRAFIFEILRISCVLPRGVPRKIWDKNGFEFEYKGKKYKVPKDTLVLNNSLYNHCNLKSENWKNNINVMEINLENWLFYDKKLNKYKLKNNSSFTAFGFGRRECIGRVIAFKVLQLFFGKILLKYRLELSEKDKQEKLIPAENLVSFLSNKLTINVSYCSET